MVRISLCIESRPSANLRLPSVSANYHACTQRLSFAFVIECDAWRLAWSRIDTDDVGATFHFDTRSPRTIEQCFLHVGVVNVQRDFAMRRGRLQIPVIERIAEHVCDPRPRLMRSCCEQIIDER